MKLRLIHVIAVICVLKFTLATTPAISQQVLFNSYVSDTFPVTYGVDGIGQFIAFLFSPTATGALNEVTVVIGRSSSVQSSTDFQLFTAPTPALLGTPLETFVVPNTVTPDSTPPFTSAPITFFSSVKPTLIAGRNYWLAFSEGEPANGVQSFWFSNFGVANGILMSNSIQSHEGVIPAFRLSIHSAASHPIRLHCAPASSQCKIPHCSSRLQVPFCRQNDFIACDCAKPPGFPGGMIFKRSLPPC